ncbi:hypothetical protein D3C76_1708140 [compost metagenome]
MFSQTIKASQRMDVSINGITAHSVARHERKVIRHSRITAPYTQISISRLACLTTMLVAASMPALPAARRNCTSSVLFAAANFSTCSTRRVSVSALWSVR